MFSGGMPRASYGDRNTVTVMQGDQHHVTFTLTSKVLDFVVVIHEEAGWYSMVSLVYYSCNGHEILSLQW